jgi:hypothetical protein
MFVDKFLVEFINDILVYSKEEEDQERHLRIVLETLQIENFYPKLKKCEFWLSEVASSHVINQQGILVDPSNVSTIID